MKKIFVTGLAFVLAIVASITGTLAWLTSKTEAVTNTFTVGDVAIDLVEHVKKYNETTGKWTVGDDTTKAEDYKLIPGTEYKKDPIVTVKANSEKCYLFVQVDTVNDPSTYLEYNLFPIKEGYTWTAGTGTGEDGNGVPVGVWYTTVDTSTTDVDFHILEDDKVTVKSTIVKRPSDAKSGETGSGENIYMPETGDDNKPKLTFTAYAIQYDNMTNVGDAWSKINIAITEGSTNEQKGN